MLLLDKKVDFELVRCAQIENVAEKVAPGPAFVFEREGRVWVAYWHTSGDTSLEFRWEKRGRAS